METKVMELTLETFTRNLESSEASLLQAVASKNSELEYYYKGRIGVFKFVIEILQGVHK